MLCFFHSKMHLWKNDNPFNLCNVIGWISIDYVWKYPGRILNALKWWSLANVDKKGSVIDATKVHAWNTLGRFYLNGHIELVAISTSNDVPTKIVAIWSFKQTAFIVALTNPFPSTDQTHRLWSIQEKKLKWRSQKISNYFGYVKKNAA